MFKFPSGISLQSSEKKKSPKSSHVEATFHTIFSATNLGRHSRKRIWNDDWSSIKADGCHKFPHHWCTGPRKIQVILTIVYFKIFHKVFKRSNIATLLLMMKRCQIRQGLFCKSSNSRSAWLLDLNSCEVLAARFPSKH